MAAASLSTACAQFEAAILRQFLATAGFARSFASDVQDDGGDAESAAGVQVGALFSEALAEVLERGGGIGLSATLARALEHSR